MLDFEMIRAFMLMFVQPHHQVEYACAALRLEIRALLFAFSIILEFSLNKIKLLNLLIAYIKQIFSPAVINRRLFSI